MRSLALVVVAFVIAVIAAGCALHVGTPGTPIASANYPNCKAAPDGVPATFRHDRNRVLSRLGTPKHRGVDLIAVEGDENQTLGGKLAYTAVDKDLEDEIVEVFACSGSGWRSLGTTRTNDDGRFALTLHGDSRLAVGMTDLYARVPGDGSGVRFLGYVATKDAAVIVTDVDGTITTSEQAIYKTVVLGRDIGHQRHAPQALAASGKTVVYITARGDQYTEVTRDWLRVHGFPPGPLRLASSAVTMPGASTVAFKTTTLRQLPVRIAAGVGNRASDIKAYRNAGLTPDRIFINLPEFTDELRTELAAGKATAFDDYRDLHAVLPKM
ncbi:MAG: hypothetical protein H0T89_22905 [Deltaproteobacteria bacterium]|nr:hypothetical protein [Deltaproteobacteria bacterium]MDQ3297717.1 hypothetical protein [Myxococcota bacterium]